MKSDLVPPHNSVVPITGSDTGIAPRDAQRNLYLSHRQVAVLAAASGQYESLVLLLAYTGLREPTSPFG